MIRLYRYLGPYKISIAGILVLIFTQCLANLYLPTLMAEIIDVGVINKDVPYIFGRGGWMLLIACGGMLCSVSASFLGARTSTALGRDVRSKLFTRVSRFSLHEVDKFGTATLITRTTNDVTQVTAVTTMILRMMIQAPLMMVGGLILAFSTDRPLTLVLVVSIPLLVGTIAFIMSKAVPLFRLMQVKLDKLNLVMREGLMGIRVIRAFDRIGREHVRFEDANEDLTQNAIRVNQIMAFIFPALLLIMNFTSIAIIWFGAMRIDTGGMEVGSLIAFLQYAMQIMFSVLMVSMMFVMVPRAQASAVRINEVLGTEPEIVDPAEPVSMRDELAHVEFDHVTFRYPGAETAAIEDISFSAHRGEVTAIIGGTGSGKSTMVHLLERFYDVSGGRILVNGIDIRNLTQEDLRHKIGFVPQRTVLFSGTIADNIRYGNKAASSEAIAAAMAVAQASDFVAGMPEGTESYLAQGGTNISGGQKQRLSIARALIRRPEIYVFDDSFSALDFKTDARLRAALKTQIADATVIIIAQRVATVMDADRIIVLDDGHIAGLGRHGELMATCAVYREIVYSQLSAEEIA